VGYLGATSAALRIGHIADLMQLLHLSTAARVAAQGRATAGRQVASHCTWQPLGEQR
jgi:hypothetical protein